MQTIELATARGKLKILADFLDGLACVPANPMTAYHAAKAARDGNQRVGIERRLKAIKTATRVFRCIVSIADDPRGIPTVRLYSPTKQIEIFF